LEELGKDDAVGPSGPDQLRPETNTRKSWPAAPDLAMSAPEIPIVPGQEGSALRHDRRRIVAEQGSAGHERAAAAYSAFERLCQRILRESGFIKVEVTGRSGDGGIDGIGVLRLNLLSFHVFFQCKRWKGSVGASVIRDFRGAMVGRADKGLVMTTGTFSTDARREANRDGAPAIDLVDGETLCELLKGLKIGVSIRKVEHVFVEQNVFLEF